MPRRLSSSRHLWFALKNCKHHAANKCVSFSPTCPFYSINLFIVVLKRVHFLKNKSLFSLINMAPDNNWPLQEATKICIFGKSLIHTTNVPLSQRVLKSQRKVQRLVFVLRADEINFSRPIPHSALFITSVLCQIFANFMQLRRTMFHIYVFPI